MQKIFRIVANYLSRWILVTFLLTMSGGFIIFPLWVQHIARECSIQKTEGMVIFTGEIEREIVAWQLYQQGLAPKFHISGRYIGFPKNRYPADITVDFAPNTLRNVQWTEQWIRCNHLRSIRLVTSDYHMPRCLLLAQQLWPPIAIVPHPVHVAHDADHPVCLILWAEYIRYILAVIGCVLRVLNE